MNTLVTVVSSDVYTLTDNYTIAIMYLDRLLLLGMLSHCKGPKYSSTILNMYTGEIPGWPVF